MALELVRHTRTPTGTPARYSSLPRGTESNRCSASPGYRYALAFTTHLSPTKDAPRSPNAGHSRSRAGGQFAAKKQIQSGFRWLDMNKMCPRVVAYSACLCSNAAREDTRRPSGSGSGRVPPSCHSASLEESCTKRTRYEGLVL